MSEEMPLLPGASWTEDNHVQTAKGARLKQWGTVEQACRMLDDCDRQAIYDLIRAGIIYGYKLKPWAANSKWKVNLTDVWQFKHGQGKGIC